MKIKCILKNKKQFMDLLLLADEQENMIDNYLERGDLFALYDDDLKSICVVTQEDVDTYELKSLATYEKFQRQGYGRRLVLHVLQLYAHKGKTIFVGTGDVPSTISFYEKCGFCLSHRVPNFFTDHYDHAIFENGVQLVDMVYLKKDL